MLKTLQKNSKTILAGLGVIWTIITTIIVFFWTFVDKEKFYAHFGFVHMTTFMEYKNANVEPIPSGVVLAFSGLCPKEKGWVPYTKASGRFIVGAGNETEKDDSGIKLPNYTINVTGGYLHTELKSENIPKYMESVTLSSFDRFERRGGGTAITGVTANFAGLDKPKSISNLPPYIALMWCIKKS